MRRLMTCLLAIGLFLGVAGCSNSEKKSKKDTDKEEKYVCDIDCDTADMSEYETMKEADHVFKVITFAQSNELLVDEKFTGIIYYGYPACPWCEEAVPVMNKVAKKDGLTIYYVNKKSQESLDHPEEEEKATKILNNAYGLTVDEETGEPRLYVPEVIVVKEGKVISHHMGTIEGHDAHERKMNEDEIRILNTIYENMFIEISE